MNQQRLKKISIITMLIWISIQIILIVLFKDTPQRSDQGAYIKMAEHCLNNNIWYPSVDDVNSSYIWAPGLINYFILQLKIFGTIKINFLLNLLMNVSIVYFTYLLAKKFFNQNIAYWSIIISCLLYSNYFIVLPAGTELPFLFLSLAGFCLCLSPDSKKIIFAGILFGLANWIRPLTMIFLIVLVIYFIYNKYKIHHYLSLFIPIFILILSIGIRNKNAIGIFNYQSTTSGVNLIMTANDKAYGGVATSLLGDSTSSCYIKNADDLTFLQKDSIWKERSIEWILNNPGKYIKLYILKVGGLFVEDSWSDRPILGGDGFVDKAAHGQTNMSDTIKRFSLMFFKSFIYYVMCCFFVYSLIKNRKNIFTPKGWILLILLIGIGITCIFSVSPRYHYPFLFVIIIWAAYGIETFLQRKKLINKDL